MLKVLGIISAGLALSACGIMPGMQNLETSRMKKVVVPHNNECHPILIPITPTLISDQKIRVYNYKVSPADVLSVNVWQHPEFDFLEKPVANMAITAGIQGAAGQPGYLVNSNGQIFFPLIGNVDVAGKTIEEIRVIITARLKKYVPDPQVNVRVADYRGQKVYVLGEIMHPGFVPITDQILSIADALTLKGWINNNSADTAHIYVIRGDYNEPEIFWLNAKTPDKLLLAERFSLRPYDILFVSSAPATQWNRVLNQLLPTIQTIWYTQAVVKNS